MVGSLPLRFADYLDVELATIRCVSAPTAPRPGHRKEITQRRRNVNERRQIELPYLHDIPPYTLRSLGRSLSREAQARGGSAVSREQIGRREGPRSSVLEAGGARQVVFPPRAGRADALASPPLVHVLVGFRRPVVVQHRAHAAPEERVDELAGALPPEVRVVQLVVAVETVEVRGQLLRRLELVHVDVRAVRRATGVVRRVRAHHDRQDVVPGSERETKESCLAVVGVGASSISVCLRATRNSMLDVAGNRGMNSTSTGCVL